jgi:hypothetical protein
LSGDSDKELGTHSATFRDCERRLDQASLASVSSPPESPIFNSI